MSFEEELLKVIVAAAAGAFFGWFSGLFSGRQKAVEEIRAWERSKRDQINTTAVGLIKEFATQAASATHSICWLTWQAKFADAQMSPQRVASYDAEMHELLPKILGAQAALSSISANAADKLVDVVARLSTLDARAGMAALEFQRGSKEPLACLHSEAARLHDEVVAALRSSAEDLLLSRGKDERGEAPTAVLDDRNIARIWTEARAWLRSLRYGR